MKITCYLLFLVAAFFIYGCVEVEELPAVEEEKGSGILMVKSVPAEADVFLNNEFKGETPLTVYGAEVGSYNVLVKKEGYATYSAVVSVDAGKRAEVDAYLSEITKIIIEEPKEEKKAEEEAEEKEKSESDFEKEAEEQANEENEKIISLGSGIVKYYDFSEEKFTDKLMTSADVFSKRYATHLAFTRYSNVNVKVVDKNIKDVKEEDCVNVLGSLGLLKSGQSLCVNTKEGLTAAIGGEWENTENAVLEWKMFS